LLFAIIPFSCALVSLIAILIGEEGVLPAFFGSIIITCGFLCIVKYTWEWVEIDEKGLHSKKLFKHIYTIEWANLDKIIKARLRDDREANFRYIANEQNAVVKNYKSVFNKSNGVIKILPTKAVEEAFIKYLPNMEKLYDIDDFGVINKLFSKQAKGIDSALEDSHDENN